MFSKRPVGKAAREVGPVPSGFDVESQSNSVPIFSAIGAANEKMICSFSIRMTQVAKVWPSPVFLLENVPCIQFIRSQQSIAR